MTKHHTLIVLAMGLCFSTAKARVVENLAAHEARSGLVTQAEITALENWIQNVGNRAKDQSAQADQQPAWISTNLPFSFVYDGQPFDRLLASWNLSVREIQKEKVHRQWQWIWTDPDTGLRVVSHIKQFSQYPALEWVLYFENTGTQETKIVENVHSLRLTLGHSQKDKGYTLYGCHGGRSKPDDFTPFEWQSDPAQASQRFVLGETFSSNRHLPFWNMATPEARGVIVGLGWTGIWKAVLEARQETLEVTAGMPDTHFRLRPGEKVRSPSVLLLFWEGQRFHGQNMLRGLLHRHYLHPVRGPRQKPLVSVNTCFTHHGKGGYLYQANATTVSPLVKPSIVLGAEAFVIDAGWFECTNWRDLGKTKQYKISRTRYPRGFRSISDPLARAGVAFGLWFWPEALGLMSESANRSKFLGTIEKLVEEENLTMYRQDVYYMGRLPQEGPERIGITPMKHYEGLYRLWDQIIARHPNMVMEGCAGGGRRVDLESIQRFSWFQKSDRWYDSESDQCGLYGASTFLPSGYLNIPTEGVDDYQVWSSFAGQLCLGWHPLDDDFDMEKAKQQVALYKQVRHLLTGDFYPLTECSLAEPWIGYQFHRRDLNEGMVLLYRRNTPYSAIDIKLTGLEPSSLYRLQFHGSGKQESYQGRELARELTIRIDQNPGAELIRYQKR